ncbi:MAG: DUF2304 domain-containing protein [Patescibacteria group bacterium]|jgi:hypothetical protein
MVIIAKILSMVIGIVVITKTFHDFRKKKENLIMSLFWIFTWLAVMVLAIFPPIIDEINRAIGGNDSGLNTFFGAAFVFLFFVTYRIYIKAHRLERQIHRMVMKIGLKDFEKQEEE